MTWFQSFRTRRNFLQLLAPGEFVVAAANGGGTASASGTSMATPHVAGAIASIREALPTATPDEIDNALALTGIPILDTRNGETTPRIQVQETIALLESTMPDPGDPPPGRRSRSRRGGGHAKFKRQWRRWLRACRRRAPSWFSDLRDSDVEHCAKGAQAPGVRITSVGRISVMSSMANFTPSRPSPLSLTPP